MTTFQTILTAIEAFTPAQRANVLRKGADRMAATKGHCNYGGSKNASGDECMGRACGEVVGIELGIDPRDWGSAFSLGERVIEAADPERFYPSVPQFNDTNTKATVIDALRKLADKLDPPVEAPKAVKVRKAPAVGTLKHTAGLWRKAAEVIRQFGHCQDGSYGGKARGFCILGARSQAEVDAEDGDSPRNYKGEDCRFVLSNALNGRDGTTSYSDKRTTTKADAIRFCQGVAYMLEHKGSLPAWAIRAKAAREAAITNPVPS